MGISFRQRHGWPAASRCHSPGLMGISFRRRLRPFVAPLRPARHSPSRKSRWAKRKTGANRRRSHSSGFASSRSRVLPSMQNKEKGGRGSLVLQLARPQSRPYKIYILSNCSRWSQLFGRPTKYEFCTIGSLSPPAPLLFCPAVCLLGFLLGSVSWVFRAAASPLRRSAPSGSPLARKDFASAPLRPNEKSTISPNNKRKIPGQATIRFSLSIISPKAKRPAVLSLETYVGS